MSRFRPTHSLPALVLSLLTLLGASSQAFAQDDSRWINVLEGEALIGYSEISGRDGTFSSIDSWLVSPTLKIDDQSYWINLYNGTFNRSAQVVSTEEGGRQSETTQSHSLSTSYKREVREGWSLRPLVFADWVFVNETEDEDFGDGLYDYQQVGAGIESVWDTLKTEDRQNEVKFGFRYLNRQYPNYHSLLALFNPNGAVEDDEKDLNGYKFNLGHKSRSKTGWSSGIEGILFFKDYTDKKTINFNGSLTGEGREDWVEQINGFVSHPINENWTFALDGQAAFNQSNLDFYDTHNTILPADDNFLKNYFDYFSFLVKPSFTYTHPWGNDGRNLTWTTDYSFYALHYEGRKAQNTAGTYGTEDEQDYVHSVSSKLSVPITKNLSWVAYGSYVSAESNQEYEAFYLYDYDLWTAVTGVSIKY